MEKWNGYDEDDARYASLMPTDADTIDDDQDREERLDDEEKEEAK